MKLTATLLLVACLQVSAKGIAQVTFSGTDVPLSKVFAVIEKQTGFYVVYNEEAIKGAKPVTIQVKNESVGNVLKECLKGQPFDFTIENKTIFIVQKPSNTPQKAASNLDEENFVRNIDVKGRVVNEYDEPVVKASVVVKGTSIGTTTDENGFFELKNVDANAILVISSINIETKEIKVGGKTDLSTVSVKIKIDESEAVVVNTGYQKVKPNEVTGSFEKIGNEQLNRQVSTDVISRLDYNANSVFFSKTRGTPEISIRGLSTLRSSTKPLIILDNFPYNGDIDNINPNDVESITILKDAAASSIWGARAGNGVIVITTKGGRYNQKFRVSLNTNVSIQQKPNFFKDRSYMSSSDFIDVEQFLFDKGFYNSTLNNVTRRPIVSPVVEILAKLDAGQISQQEADAQINTYRNLDVRNDYHKYLFRQALNQQYSLSISGGSEQLNYYVNLGYDKNLNNVVGNQSDRATLFTNFSFRPIRKLEIQTGIVLTGNTTRTNGISNLNPGSSKSRYYPYAQLADANGNPLALPKDYRMQYIDTAGGDLLLDWHYRPLDELNYANNKSNNQHILLRTSIKYDVIKSLSIEVNSQLERGFQDMNNFFSQDTYFTRNWINRYSQISNGTVTRNVPLGGILNQSNGKLNSYNLRGKISYEKNWNNMHQVSAIAGGEISEAHYEANSSRVYGYDNDKLVYANVDYLTTFQLFDNLGSGSIPSEIDFANTTNRIVSLYSSATYTYRNTYSVSLVARKDAANLFGVNTNNKWKPLWSAGLSWKISEERFYKFSNQLPLLRLRATYGYNGNPPVAVAQTTISYISAPNGFTNLLYSNIASFPNPELRWEKVGTLNIGVDFATRDQRITGSIEYYKKKSTDLISNYPIDPTTGIENVDANVAHLGGNGLDVKLSAAIVNNHLKWQSTINFSFIKNKVLKYFDESNNKGGYPGFNYNITPIEGKDPYALMSYRWGGLDPNTGDPIGFINGVESTDYINITRPTTFDDIVFTGSTRPPYFGNWMNTFFFKGFQLSANISYRFNYYFRRNTINYNGLYNNWSTHSDFSLRWQEPGDELVTTVPSMTYPPNATRDNFYATSEATVEKGDHVRLTDINFNYTFPKIRIANGTISNLNLYMYLKNVGILWRANEKDIDPEFGDILPAPLSISFGIRANF